MGAISYPIISAIQRNTDIDIDFLCDNDPGKWGKTFHGGIPCISPLELEAYRGEVAVLITTQHYAAIREQLRARGFEPSSSSPSTACSTVSISRFPRTSTIRDSVVQLAGVLADERSKEILSVLVRNWSSFDIEGPGYLDICCPISTTPPIS